SPSTLRTHHLSEVDRGFSGERGRLFRSRNKNVLELRVTANLGNQLVNRRPIAFPPLCVGHGDDDVAHVVLSRSQLLGDIRTEERSKFTKLCHSLPRRGLHDCAMKRDRHPLDGGLQFTNWGILFSRHVLSSLSF